MANEKGGELISWKEIAAYLGVDVRTCQRWEREFGLPILRLNQASKSRVCAQKSDLDVWKQTNYIKTKEKPKEPAGERHAGRTPHRNRFIWLGVFGAGIAILFTGIALFSRPKDKNPADFLIDKSRLIILNAKRKQLAARNIPDESYEHGRIQGPL